MSPSAPPSASAPAPAPAEGPPPILGSWGRMYALVLGALCVVVAILAWLTQVYT